MDRPITQLSGHNYYYQWIVIIIKSSNGIQEDKTQKSILTNDFVFLFSVIICQKSYKISQTYLFQLALILKNMGQCLSVDKQPQNILQNQRTKSPIPQLIIKEQQVLKKEQARPNSKVQIKIKESAASTSKNVQTVASNQQRRIESLYREKLKQQVMGYVTDLPNSLFKARANSSQPKLKRLSKEIVKFSEFLPCQHTNAIFVRCDQIRMDSMNVLISGATGTPYANGLYLFELFCDDSFPNAPPKMQLLTGKGKISFNPNLYINGYICLSLLGTWPGQPEQSWNPTTSSLAQVFVSIQSIIMNNDIYFNQPGLQGMKGTYQGNIYNQGFSNVVKIANIRHAMIEVIKKPPIGFENIVKRHFLIKKDEILKECSQWLSRKDRPFSICGNNPDLQSQIEHSYGQVLKRQIEQLKLILATIKDQQLA